MAQTMMTIGTLARRAGVNSRTVRFYERIGLLTPPARTTAGYRIYTGAEEERLRFIRRAQAAGLSLTDIAGILAIRANGAAPCRVVRALAEAKAEDIAQKIRVLEQARLNLLHLAEIARDIEPACAQATSAICLAFDKEPLASDRVATSSESPSRP